MGPGGMWTITHQPALGLNAFRLISMLAPSRSHRAGPNLLSCPCTGRALVMLAPHTLSLHQQGRIFLDRCGQLFAEVLSLLREGPKWRPPEDRCAWRPVGAMYMAWGGGGVGGWGAVREAAATAAVWVQA